MIVALLAAVAVFLLDAVTPLGTGVSVGYVVAIALCLRRERALDVVAVAGVASALSLAALLFKPAVHARVS